MRYMMFIKHTEDYRGREIPAGLIEAMGEFIGEYTKQGKFIDGAGLKSSHKGKKIQLRNGQLRVVDGPFTESKELVGGYAIMEHPTREAAVEAGRWLMEMHKTYWPEWEGWVDVRPVYEAAEAPATR